MRNIKLSYPEYDIRIDGPSTPVAKFNISYKEMDGSSVVFKTEAEADAFQFAICSELRIPSDVSENEGSWIVVIKSRNHYLFDEGIGESLHKSITVMKCCPPFEIVKK